VQTVRRASASITIKHYLVVSCFPWSSWHRLRHLRRPNDELTHLQLCIWTTPLTLVCLHQPPVNSHQDTSVGSPMDPTTGSLEDPSTLWAELNMLILIFRLRTSTAPSQWLPTYPPMRDQADVVPNMRRPNDELTHLQLCIWTTPLPLVCLHQPHVNSPQDTSVDPIYRLARRSIYAVG